jgi:hypothetical protein
VAVGKKLTSDVFPARAAVHAVPLFPRSASCRCYRSTGSSAWRALGNLIGNCVATVVVAAWEGDLDRAKAQRILKG